MALTVEWRRRVEAWLAALKERTVRPIADVAVEGFITPEQLRPEAAAAGPFAPLEPGLSWGGYGRYLWMRGTAVIPEEAAGRRVALALAGDAECIVWVDGRIRGSHGWAASPVTLAAAAEPGAAYELLIEASSTVAWSRWWGLISRGPRYPGDPGSHEGKPPAHTLVPPALLVCNEEIYQLSIDLQTLLELRDGLADTALRQAEIDRGLMDATLICDPERPEAELRQAALAARERLRPLLERRNGPTAPTLYMIGHGHLDLAWLWPLVETRRKMARTIANQLALFEEYPEHRFLQSQPWLFERLREDYPELYERALAAVRAGNIVADGAMYVEADTNISGGEALIRQIVRGRRFFREELGVESEILWLPDVFGYSGALPQIMRGCGVLGFATQKITWAYSGGDPFPYSIFMWEGIDGSAVPAHIFKEYNSETRPEALFKRWETRQQKDNEVRSMIVAYGWGDGGGGPNRNHAEFLRRVEDLEGLPRTRVAPPAAFFADIAKGGPPRARYVGELYFQGHRGTYTSQARTKAFNRRVEHALRRAEIWGSAARALAGHTFSPRTLDAQWSALLLHQFHDILPGSSIGRVYAEAEAAYAAALAETEGAAAAATAALADGDPAAATVFNSLSWPRRELVALPAGWAGAATASGEPLPAQRVDGQLLAEVVLPPVGWATLRQAAGPAEGGPGVRLERLAGGGYLLENELLRVEVGPRGELSSALDKASGFEALAAPGNSLRLSKDIPIWWDAWDIEEMAEHELVPTDEPVELEPLEAGPLVARLRLRRRLSASTVEQVICLRRGSRRVEFATEVDWRERHRLLKVAFPTTVHATEALHEIQFGHIRRPTHRSRPYEADQFEVCNYRWTALAEEGRGVAVLNDCKYGISTAGGTMSLTLLKAAMGPDEHADQGMQRFTYALFVWDGPLLASGLVAEAAALNEPATLAPGAARGGDRSLLTLDRPNVVVEALKPAEDGSGDLIVRLYEAGRTRTRCRLGLDLPVAGAAECDMLEREQRELPLAGGAVELELRPFEIKTVRLRV
jgi:alpha-mannosidase